MTLYFDNETEYPVDDKLEQLMETVIQSVCKLEEIPENIEVSLSFVSNEQIKQLNSEYRNKDTETDVLSFPMMDCVDGERNLEQVKNPETGDYMLGDIIISTDRALEQAKDFGHSNEREIGFLIAHSMLHLLGYDHMTDEEEEIMITKQKEIMSQVGLNR